MKDHVRQWIDELKHTATARRLGRCKYCSEKPSLGREQTEESDKALWWCKGCKRAAYGERASYANVSIKVLMSLPIVVVVGPSQGVLL